MCCIIHRQQLQASLSNWASRDWTRERCCFRKKKKKRRLRREVTCTQLDQHSASHSRGHNRAKTSRVLPGASSTGRVSSPTAPRRRQLWMQPGSKKSGLSFYTSWQGDSRRSSRSSFDIQMKSHLHPAPRQAGDKADVPRSDTLVGTAGSEKDTNSFRKESR